VTPGLADLVTPALVLDLDVLEANIGRMAERFAALPAELRPHVKAHKSSRIARLQCDAGAIGVTAATTAEALAMVAAGVGDVLIANQIVSEPQLARLASAAAEARIAVAVDDAVQVEAASRAGRRAGAIVGIVIEVDVGMGRAGARSPAEAVSLAELAARLPGVDLRGVMGYEGHCTDEPDRARRTVAATAAVEILAAAAAELERASLPCGIVSAGGTGTYDVTGACPGVTEVQAGTYAIMDEFHRAVTPEFGSALTVLATVTSLHGSLVVLDAGRKAIAADLAAPRVVGREAHVEFVHEEHSGFRVDGSGLRIGDRVSLAPGYAPSAVNLHAAYNVVRNGTLVDTWPVEARYSSAPTALA
jgi:3-hydroxy-D-aspartate aldolase